MVKLYKYERPHRVRLYTTQLHLNDSFNLSKRELFWHAADKFKDTDRYAWVEANNVELDFEVDDNAVSWFKQVRFFADLTEHQYTDYCLRFFDHWDEDWK